MKAQMVRNRELINPIQKSFLSSSILLIFFSLSSYQSILRAQTIPEVVADEFYSPQLLNSERIKKKFGSYGIEVLKTSPSLRISNLYSLSEGQKITRTFAVVQYPQTINPAYSREHQIIANGGSIGQVFKEANWNITKRNLFFGSLAATPDYKKVYDLMGLKTPHELAVRIYQFQISKNELSYAYATIIEVHHPFYLSFNDLTRINTDAINYFSTDKVKSQLELLDIIPSNLDVY
jgi:hypothetical protein